MCAHCVMFDVHSTAIRVDSEHAIVIDGTRKKTTHEFNKIMRSRCTHIHPKWRKNNDWSNFGELQSHQIAGKCDVLQAEWTAQHAARENKNPINALSKGGSIRLFPLDSFFFHFIFNFVYSDEICRKKTEMYLKHSPRPYSVRFVGTAERNSRSRFEQRLK